MWIKREIEIFTNKVSVGIKKIIQRETKKCLETMCTNWCKYVCLFFIFISLPCNLVMRNKYIFIQHREKCRNLLFLYRGKNNGKSRMALIMFIQ